MHADPRPPVVLLAEDDPISREFLASALHACGVAAEVLNDGVQVLEFARTHACSLLILDQNLPGLTGTEILRQLELASRATRSERAPAIAITAAPDELSPQLLAAGFAEVLPKPITGAAIRAALQRHHQLPVAVLDDDAAIAACGSPDVGRRLRRLFLDQELPAVLAEFDARRDDLARLRPTLHRLRASCGFCGAPELAGAAAALHRALVAGEPASGAAARFRAQLARTMAALRAKLDAE